MMKSNRKKERQTDLNKKEKKERRNPAYSWIVLKLCLCFLVGSLEKGEWSTGDKRRAIQRHEHWRSECAFKGEHGEGEGGGGGGAVGGGVGGRKGQESIYEEKTGFPYAQKRNTEINKPTMMSSRTLGVLLFTMLSGHVSLYRHHTEMGGAMPRWGILGSMIGYNILLTESGEWCIYMPYYKRPSNQWKIKHRQTKKQMPPYSLS